MRSVFCWSALALMSMPCIFGQLIEGPPQTLTQTGTRRTVTGTVVNSVTAEPIRRALVRMNGQRQQFAFTGPDGRFQLEGVPDGQVYITAQKPGFFDQTSLGQMFVRPNPLVMIGPNTGEVLLKLIPEAKIRGRIMDGDGEPAESVSVQVMAQAIVNGRKEWQQRGGAMTDENGLYRLEDLQPGTYIISTGTSAAPAKPSNVSAQGKLVPEVYPPEFYPNAPDRSAAQRITLTAGEEFQADFTLAPVHAFVVSGVVSGAQQGVGIMLQDADGQFVGVGFRFDPRTGQFAALQIPAGSWTLRFQSNDAQGHTYFAEQPVNLSTSDIHGLQVQLQPLASIPVHVATDTEQIMGVQVQLTSDKTAQQNYGNSFQAGKNAPGPQIFEGVAPGNYKVSAQAFGPGCVTSIMSGAVDLTREDLHVAVGSDTQPIQITLSEDCATLSGSVAGQSSDASGFIVVVPDSQTFTPMVLPIQAKSFSFSNLRPGSYRLYAFTDVSDLEYANPEALRDFTGEQLELSAGQKAEVELQLNSRGKP